jgi:hypothetical protein
VRRGVHHGYLSHGGSRARPPDAETASVQWAAAEPIYWPRLLDVGEPAMRSAIRRTLHSFERVRGSRAFDFQEEVWRRLSGRRGFAAAGSSVDLGDEREIEKVHVDRGADRDLWAKLSWISLDPRDGSLRIRFSFGSERLGDWQRDDSRAESADRLADAVFPECGLLTRNLPLRRTLAKLVGERTRLSERIVFSNAPGGGAVFHHDGEPRQRGVVFGQLAGRTAWLALPKRRLAAEVAKLAGLTPAAAMKALDRGDSPRLERLMNHSRRLTKALVAAGDCRVLGPGDVLVLPSHGPDDVAWHSVFGLGERPSLAHSYGLFVTR